MTASFAVDPPHDVLWVTGGDAVSFLDGLVTQSVAAMEVGSVLRALLLSPRGKLTAPLWLLRGTDQVGIAVEAGHGTDVASAILRYRIRVDATVAVDGRPRIEVWGEAAAALADEGAWSDGDGFTADLPLIHGGVRRVLTTQTSLAVDVAPSEVAEAWRIAAGEPRLGVDVGDDTIPEEAWLVSGAVDFEKGCYLGQELVARIDSRGHVNRRLRGLLLAAPVATGATVTRDGTAVGTVTSTARSPDLGPIALAMIRAEVHGGDEVEVGTVPATATDLPIG